MLVGQVLATSTPGAPRSTVCTPKFENEASVSERLVAATQRMLGRSELQGKSEPMSLLRAELPAATTNSVLGAFCIARRSASSGVLAPSERLTTRAPILPA